MEEAIQRWAELCAEYWICEHIFLRKYHRSYLIQYVKQYLKMCFCMFMKKCSWYCIFWWQPSISKMWADEMKLLDTQRDIARELKEDQERSQPIETNSPPSPQAKKDRKKKVKKTSDPSPKAVNVWEEYPEFLPLNYQPSSDILRHVTGSQLLYPQPWWQLDSVSCWKWCCVVIILSNSRNNLHRFYKQVLIPCHVNDDHWLLCHVLLKEGKVRVYDSLNERRSGYSPRLKDIRGLLYLLPSVLKHAGYYEHMKMDPHGTPFTAQSMHSDLIPQQDDGYVWHIYLLFLHFIYFPKNTNVWHFP